MTVRLSDLGRDVALAATLALLLGVAAGWPEVAFVGATGAVALGVALAWIVDRSPRSTSVSALPSRVTPPASSLLTTRVEPRRRRTFVRVLVSIDGVPHAADRITVVGERGRAVDVPWSLPTLTRGEHTVGPIVARTNDPLELLRRDRRLAGTQTVLVHPYCHPMRAVPETLDRELDGPVSAIAVPAGRAEDGVREYEDGDDLRLIHAPQSRRRGTIMLRRRVAARASAAVIVLDTSMAAYDDEQRFDEAVSVAASLVRASATIDRPVEVHAAGALLLRGVGPAVVEPALDALARVTRHARAPGLEALHRSARSAACHVVITGTPTPTALAAVTALGRRRPVAGIVALTDDTPPVTVRQLVTAPDAVTAAHAWNRLMIRR